MADRIGRFPPPVVSRFVQKPVTVKGVEIKASWYDLPFNDQIDLGVKTSTLERFPALQARAATADKNHDGWLGADDLYEVKSPKYAFLRPGARAAAEEANALPREVLAEGLVETLVQAGGTKKEFAKATAVQLDDELVIHFKDTGFTLVAASLARERPRDANTEGPPAEPTPESIAKCPNPFLPSTARTLSRPFDPEPQVPVANCQVDLINSQGASVLWDRQDYCGFDLRFDLEAGKLWVDESGVGTPTMYDLNSGKIENRWLTIEDAKVARLDATADLPWNDVTSRVSSAKYAGNGRVEYLVREPSGYVKERSCSLPFAPEKVFGPVAG